MRDRRIYVRGGAKAYFVETFNMLEDSQNVDVL